MGTLLIIIGVLWLLQRAGVLAGTFWQYFWPILVILLGVKIALGNRGGWRNPPPPVPPTS